MECSKSVNNTIHHWQVAFDDRKHLVRVDVPVVVKEDRSLAGAHYLARC